MQRFPVRITWKEETVSLVLFNSNANSVVKESGNHEDCPQLNSFLPYIIFSFVPSLSLFWYLWPSAYLRHCSTNQDSFCCKGWKIQLKEGEFTDLGTCEVPGLVGSSAAHVMSSGPRHSASVNSILLHVGFIFRLHRVANRAASKPGPANSQIWVQQERPIASRWLLGPHVHDEPILVVRESNPLGDKSESQSCPWNWEWNEFYLKHKTLKRGKECLHRGELVVLSAGRWMGAKQHWLPFIALILPNLSSETPMILFATCIKSKVCMWHSRLLTVLICFSPCFLFHSRVWFTFKTSPSSYGFWFSVSPIHLVNILYIIECPAQMLPHSKPGKSGSLSAFYRWGHWSTKRVRNLVKMTPAAVPEFRFSGILDPESSLNVLCHLRQVRWTDTSMIPYSTSTSDTWKPVSKKEMCYIGDFSYPDFLYKDMGISHCYSMLFLSCLSFV